MKKLVQFLKKVDDTMSHMSNEKLQTCVYEFARTLPENKRQYSLETMVAVQKSKSFSTMFLKNNCDEIYSEINTIKGVLTSINEGNRCLDSEYKEEWDDWYNSDVDEILFSDPERLLQDIEKGIDLLHKCEGKEGVKADTIPKL